MRVAVICFIFLCSFSSLPFQFLLSFVFLCVLFSLNPDFFPFFGLCGDVVFGFSPSQMSLPSLLLPKASGHPVWADLPLLPSQSALYAHARRFVITKITQDSTWRR